jgi:hypothetical protein
MRMAPTVTLYVLPCGDPIHHNPQRATLSFEGVATRIIEVSDDERCFQFNRYHKVGTDYYAFLYSDEEIDVFLKEALPIFLNHSFDFLVFYAKVPDEKSSPGFRVFMYPRIFRKTVRLHANRLLPINFQTLRSEKILNGWLHGRTLGRNKIVPA